MVSLAHWLSWSLYILWLVLHGSQLLSLCRFYVTASQSASQPLRVSFGSTLIRVLSIEDKNCKFYNSFLFTRHTSSFVFQFQCFSSSVQHKKNNFQR